MKTLKQRVEQAAGISAATCAREASPENNYNVILALKSTVYALVMELETVANWLDDDAEIPPGVRQSYRDLANAYRDVYRRRDEIKSKTAACEPDRDSRPSPYRESDVSGAIGADGYCYSDADPGL